MAQNPDTTTSVGGDNGYSVYDKGSEAEAAVAGVYVNLAGNDAVQKAVIVLQDATITMADNAGVVAYGSIELLDLPAGVIAVLGATANLAMTKSSAGINANFDGDFGIGSAAAGNSATLTSTEQDVLPTTATPQAAAGATTATGGSTAAAYLDGATGSAKKLYLNFLIDDADHDVTGTPANLIANGTITVLYANLGNF